MGEHIFKLCKRCETETLSDRKFCYKCGYRFTTEDTFLQQNKKFLIDLALDTKDYEWILQLNRGIITDVK